MFSLMPTHPILSPINGALIDLPSPSSISSWWNFGSLLGMCLSLQLVTGIFLAMQYTGDTNLSFESVSHMNQDVMEGSLLRMLHANGASFFFFCLYFHAGRGMYYGSYAFHPTWGIGVIILLVVMATAFLGYVLPWGQMSFWGTSVITNLLSALPVIGGDVVMWLWGGFAVGNPTLTRFFAFHFLVPFIIAAMAVVHLMFLHQTGSNNPMGLMAGFDKIPFHPYFSAKDFMGALFTGFLLTLLVLSSPWLLGDPENFIMSNPLVTPVHIQPEWYFLFAYAILRSIPNKLGGVIALAMAILILLSAALFRESKFRNISFYSFNKFYFWTLVASVILLTWIGARPVEEPYIVMGQLLTIYYFLFYALASNLQSLWDQALN